METITGKLKVEQDFLKSRARDYKNIPNFKVAIESAIIKDATLLTKTVMAEPRFF